MSANSSNPLNSLNAAAAAPGGPEPAVIYPRSPRETMAGWMHLSRYIDKIRLYLAGRLHPDYQPNFGKGFDGQWLKEAGLTHEGFIEVVRGTITDGEVADWVGRNVRRTPEAKAAHAAGMFDYPRADDVAGQERLRQRKAQTGLSGRDDIRNFIEFIDADEKRT